MTRPRDRASAAGLLPRMEARPRKDGLTTYRYHPLGGKPINLGTDRTAAIRRVADMLRLKAGLTPLVPAPSAPVPSPAEDRGYEGTALQAYHREWNAHRAALAAAAAAAAAEWRRLNPPELIAARSKEKRRALVRHHSGARRAAKLQRTPSWADMGKILAVYAEARRLTAETGIAHHVDHIIPLQGDVVSGLHVETNLQVLAGPDNCRKRNKFDQC